MATTSDERLLEYAVERIWKVMWIVAGGGAVGLFVWRGWTWSAGWLIGSAVSALNFRWLKQLTDSLGDTAAKPRKAVFLGMRYLLLGGGAYVILKYSPISLSAALAGLFVSVVAVIVEILFELIYARNGTVDH
jgi:ATP synthase I chain